MWLEPSYKRFEMSVLVVLETVSLFCRFVVVVVVCV